MSLLKRLQDVVVETSLLLLDTNNRFRDALGRINQDPPQYTADNLTADVTQTALRTLQLMMKFWMPLSDPLLPTATISHPANQIAGNPGLTATVSLNESVPLYMLPSVSPLVFMGWSAVAAPTDASQIPPPFRADPDPRNRHGRAPTADHRDPERPGWASRRARDLPGLRACRAGSRSRRGGARAVGSWGARAVAS